MEIQKISNSQSNLEKELNWRNQPVWLQALLQSYSYQDFKDIKIPLHAEEGVEKREPLTLLVGMQTNRATMEKNVEIP